MIPPADQHEDWYSPPEIGRRYRFAPETLIDAINRNELKASNTSAPGKRPRWRIKLADFEAYMARRSNVAMEKPPRVRRQREPANIVEFY